MAYITSIRANISSAYGPYTHGDVTCIHACTSVLNTNLVEKVHHIYVDFRGVSEPPAVFDASKAPEARILLWHAAYAIAWRKQVHSPAKLPQVYRNQLYFSFSSSGFLNTQRNLRSLVPKIRVITVMGGLGGYFQVSSLHYILCFGRCLRGGNSFYAKCRASA